MTEPKEPTIPNFDLEAAPEDATGGKKRGRPAKVSVQPMPILSDELPGELPAPEPIVATAPERKTRKAKKVELSADDLAQIEEEAEAEALADILADQRKAAKAKAVKAAKARLSRDPNEQFVTCTLVLQPFQHELILDGRRYFHGRTYTVPRSVYDVFCEQAQRGHLHQLEIEGKKRGTEAYRRPHETVVSGATGVSNAPTANKMAA